MVTINYFILNFYNDLHNFMKKENSTSSLLFAPEFSDIKGKYDNHNCSHCDSHNIEKCQPNNRSSVVLTHCSVFRV